MLSFDSDFERRGMIASSADSRGISGGRGRGVVEQPTLKSFLLSSAEDEERERERGQFPNGTL